MICQRNEYSCNASDAYEVSKNLNCVLENLCFCADNNEIAKYIFRLGPYLYPFSIEFSILVGEF